MRAVLLIIAALSLAACASTAQTSNVTPHTATRIVAHNSSGITLDLRSYFGTGVSTNVNSKIVIQKCIASITPNDFWIKGGEFQKISITANDQGTCKDASRGAEFVVTSISFLGIFVGVLHVTYAPAPATWTAKLDLADPKWKICSEPPGIDKGIPVENNSNVALKFC